VFAPINEPTFLNGLNLQALTSITDKTSMSLLMSSELDDVLQLLVHALRPHTAAVETVWNWLTDEIKSGSSPFLCDYITMFIVLFREMGSRCLVSEYWSTLLVSPVFDDRLNVLDDQPDDVLVDQLRALAIHASLQNEYCSVDQIIMLFASKRKLLVALFDRFLVFYHQIPTNELQQKLLMRAVSTMILYCQRAHINCGTANRKLIEAMRANVFLFVHKILEDITLAAAWFTNPVFMSTFTSLVFEPAVRGWSLAN
jgi:hypothetical protein